MATGAPVSRIIVLGGSGTFGQAVTSGLRAQRLAPLVAGRRVAEATLRLDANDEAGLRKHLVSGDLLIDAAGPFQTRSAALLRAATDVGVDVIDLNDSYSYAQLVMGAEERIAASGIRFLSGCSTVSAVAAAAIRLSGCECPRSVSVGLAPATKHTARPGSARSLIRSVGRPVRALENGRPIMRGGWSEKKEFPCPPPYGSLSGHLFESADAVHLPTIWPSLERVDMYIDTHAAGLNGLLSVSARVGGLRWLLERGVRWGTPLVRRWGTSMSRLVYEIGGWLGRVSVRGFCGTLGRLCRRGGSCRARGAGHSPGHVPGAWARTAGPTSA